MSLPRVYLGNQHRLEARSCPEWILNCSYRTTKGKCKIHRDAGQNHQASQG
jgi:hypothetical protein